MILEAIVTTRNQDNSTNIAPMGPFVSDDGFEQFELRPFQSSTTYQNLCRSPQGVLHITDDVMLFAQGALNMLPDDIQLESASCVDVQSLSDACRWCEFEVTAITAITQRASLQCRTICQRQGRAFFGFNRAKHAVIEATILATRVDFLPLDEITSQLDRLAKTVDKTGGRQEQRAFQLICDYVFNLTAGDSSCASRSKMSSR